MKFIYTLLFLGIFALLVNDIKGSDHGEAAAEPNAESVEEEPDSEEEGHHGPTWGYNIVDSHGESIGPEKWGEILPERCGPQLKRQSPINIEPSNAKYDKSLTTNHIDLLIKTPNKTRTLSLYNNGHTTGVGFLSTNIYVQGGGLRDVFRVAGLHFHWGSDSNRGSEHRIDGKMYPLEMHIVNYDAEKYIDLGEALGGQDSLAVLGVFFEESKEDNVALNAIFDNLQHVIQPAHGAQDITVIPYFDLRTLLPSNTRDFYRYLGSLTTPTCNEIVIWTVFKTPITVSTNQLQKLRKLHEIAQADGTMLNLQNNYRPPQPLHGRVVSSSFVPPKKVRKITKQNRDRAQQATQGDNAASLSIASGLTVLLVSLLSQAF